MSEELLKKSVTAQELSDDEMTEVTGGQGSAGGSNGTTVNSAAEVTTFCPACGKVTQFRVASGGRGFCTVCGTQKMI